MEAIVFILIIVLSLISANNKKKKQGAAKPGGAPARPSAMARGSKAFAALERALEEAGKAAEEAPSGPSPVQKKQQAEAEAALKQAAEKARRRVAAAKLQARGRPGMPAQPAVQPVAQGESHADDEGCVGGSLSHDHAEGESRAEHDRHVAAMQARDRDEAPAQRAGIDAAQLRRAVVMAEILDRPKALRRRAG